MAAQRRHWKEKDGRYWARISIPKQLRPSFGGKTELSTPLGGDLKIASRDHAAAVAQLQQQIERARGSVAAHPTRALTELPPSVSMTLEDQQQAAWPHYNAILKQLELKRAEMPSPTEIETERERVFERIATGEGDVDLGPAAVFNLHTDFELKAGARQFDANIRSRRLNALRCMIV